MKNYLTFLIMFLFIGLSYSQTYTYSFPTPQGTRWVEIKIDTLLFNEAIHVTKRYLPNNSSVNQNPYSLVFIGDFLFEGDSIELDYANYRYFWIPFKPDKPFYGLNTEDLEEYEESAYIYYGVNVDTGLAEGRASGDFWYMCSCNGSTVHPGDCKASMTGPNQQVNCGLDGTCEEGCIGYADIIDFGNFGGGGIFVKVNALKYKMYHNFQIE